MQTLRKRLVHEFLAVLPPTIFFFVGFQLIAFTRALMLERYGIRVSTFVTATVAALLVAKVVMIVDKLPWVDRFRGRPRAYRVAWMTLLYVVGALVVRYLEHMFHFVREHGSLVAAHRALLGEIVWPHFWAVQIWLAVLFLVYCSGRELVRALGASRLRSLFFGADAHA